MPETEEPSHREREVRDATDRLRALLPEESLAERIADPLDAFVKNVASLLALSPTQADGLRSRTADELARLGAPPLP